MSAAPAGTRSPFVQFGSQLCMGCIGHFFPLSSYTYMMQVNTNKHWTTEGDPAWSSPGPLLMSFLFISPLTPYTPQVLKKAAGLGSSLLAFSNSAQV